MVGILGDTTLFHRLTLSDSGYIVVSPLEYTTILEERRKIIVLRASLAIFQGGLFLPK